MLFYSMTSKLLKETRCQRISVKEQQVSQLQAKSQQEQNSTHSGRMSSWSLSSAGTLTSDLRLAAMFTLKNLKICHKKGINS